MNEAEFQKKLAAAFAIEAGEHLAVLTSGLLGLEKETNPDRRRTMVETIFREAHSLKGAARAVNRSDVESICQALETVFAVWKRQPVPVSSATFDLLNKAVDVLDRILRLPGDATAPSDKAVVLQIVQQLGRPAPPGPAPKPAEVVPVPPSSSSPVPPAPAPSEHVETIRVPTVRMNALLRQAEELVSLKLTMRSRAAETRELTDAFATWRATPRQEPGGQRDAQDPFLNALESQLVGLTQQTARDAHAASGMIDALLEDAKQLSMLPFSTLLDLAPKLVRDLAREQGKEIALALHGREIEIDKRILDELKDPLVHLLRNAIDHGIETPSERAQRGKPAQAKLAITVSQREGSKVRVAIAEDGGGIDVAKVKSAAVKSGVITDDESADLTEPAARALIFQSGVSTSAIVTHLSGRGLGMAIVREKVERLGGQIAIESVYGEGTTFIITLPITLSTVAGIVFDVGGQRYVIPSASVGRIVRFKPEEVDSTDGTPELSMDGRKLPLARLSDVLEQPRTRARSDVGYLQAVVLGTGHEEVAFIVDDVLEELEVLTKELGRPLLRVRNVAAATVLGSGAPVLILNVPDLLKSALRHSDSREPVPAEAAAPTAPPELLVVDDSVTSRMLLKNILESVGYEVATAPDGAEAMALLKTRPFGLVVSDVEMPRMDGFELTARIRADAQLRELPVVLVTSLGSREDQARGVSAGANAYIIKGNFEQSDLVATVRKLI